jgi:hypothetical protein
MTARTVYEEEYRCAAPLRDNAGDDYMMFESLFDGQKGDVRLFRQMSLTRAVFLACVGLVALIASVCMLAALLFPPQLRSAERESSIQGQMERKIATVIKPIVRSPALLDRKGETLPAQVVQPFGRLVWFARNVARSEIAFASRLTKIGLDRQAREVLFGPGGSLSSSAALDKNLEGTGAIVIGINDQMVVSADEDSPQSYPLSAAALADQQSRAARYGSPGPEASAGERGSDRSLAMAAPGPNNRPRVFDASEGTPLDPLRNQTYDLNFPKVVPSFK